MPVLRFRVYWEEDDLVYRDIEIQGNQSFLELHQGILKAFEFDQKHEGSFFESNDRWHRGREISSEVTVNKKGAPALSMLKTPVSALISSPDQHFVYEYDRVKKWTFLVALIGMEAEPDENKEYPFTLRREGLAPTQYGVKNVPGTERAMETVEAYDLGADEMAEGFGSEGEDTDAGSSDDSYDNSFEETF